MLGTVLERMHSGQVLSQHDVSAALREYNVLQSKMADLQQKVDVAKVHVWIKLISIIRLYQMIV